PTVDDIGATRVINGESRAYANATPAGGITPPEGPAPAKSRRRATQGPATPQALPTRALPPTPRSRPNCKVPCRKVGSEAAVPQLKSAAAPIPVQSRSARTRRAKPVLRPQRGSLPRPFADRSHLYGARHYRP